MRRQRTRWDWSLGAIVLAHFGIAVAHGQAHQGAAILLPPAGNTFVLTVIVAGPVLALLWSYLTGSRAATWLIALLMAASLIFGVVNHFVIESPDHVLHVAGPWRIWFGATAVLLSATEALGAGLGAWHAATMVRRMS